MQRQTTTPPAPILSLLRRLRRRIRWYVWLESATLAIAWLGFAYWVGLALDYLPVLLGSSEMPAGARLVLLVVTSAILVFILDRWLGQRLRMRLTPSRLALLAEKYFPQFHDALMTAVEIPAESVERGSLAESMLEETLQTASTKADDLPLSRVFNFRPLLRNAGLAADRDPVDWIVRALGGATPLVCGRRGGCCCRTIPGPDVPTSNCWNLTMARSASRKAPMSHCMYGPRRRVPPRPLNCARSTTVWRAARKDERT